MKRIAIAALAALTMAGCSKECGPLEVKQSDECVDWTVRVVGTWHGTGTCTNGGEFRGPLVLDAGPTATSLRVDGIDLHMTSATTIVGGPVNLGNGQSIIRVRYEGYYQPWQSTTTTNSSGQTVAGPTIPETLRWIAVVEEGTPQQNICEVSLSK